jgi:hypothetical protein
MDATLVVVQPFGPHHRGDLITDADAVKAVLASENAARVVRIVLPMPKEP